MPPDKSKLITCFCQSIDGSLQRLWQMGLEFWAEKSNTHSLFEHNIFWRIKLWASWDSRVERGLKVFENLWKTSTHDLRTLWSPSVSLNQERNTQRRKAVFLFLKSPPWNPLLADLIIVFFNSLSPQGSVLFTVPSSKQPLPSGAKQATYTTHSWDFRPCHHRPPPPNTHNSLMPGSVTAVGGAGPGPIGLLWWTRPDTPMAGPVGGNPGVRECRAGPDRPSVTNPSSVTDGRSEFIDRIEQQQMQLFWLKWFEKTPPPHMPPNKSKLMTGFCQSIDGNLQRLWQMRLEFWAEKSNTHSLFEHNIFGESNFGPPECHLLHDDNLNQKVTLKDTTM